MFIQVVGIVLLIIAAGILVLDASSIMNTWLYRIHIGRYENRILWLKCVTNKCIKWLSNTPRIKVTDNTRLIIIDMLKGNYSKSNIQHWQEAALVLGLSEYLKYNDDTEVKNKIIEFLNRKFDKNGQWKDKPKYIDAAIFAYAIMKLDFINIDKYKNAADYIWDMIKLHIGEDGTIEYRKFMKSYRYVDTLGFICPFLILYGIRYKKEECIDIAIRQLSEYEKYGMLSEQYLPCHAYEIQGKVPLGLYGWGRGLGWFSIGLVDSWNELPDNHKYKPLLQESVKKFAKAAMSFQQSNGSWNWTVTRNECRADSSATAALSWFMLNASKIAEISKECLESVDRALNYLMTVTRRNGTIDFSQGDTKDIGVYSMLFDILPFTQGFALRSISLLVGENIKITKHN